MNYIKNLFSFNLIQLAIYIVILLACILLLISNINKQTSKQFIPYNELMNQLNKISSITINGNKNIMFYEDSSKNTISIQIRIKGGNLLDLKGNEGLSYLISKLLIYKTSNMDNIELQRFLDNTSINLSSNVSVDSININIKGLVYYKRQIFELLTSIINNKNYSYKDIQYVREIIKKDKKLFNNTNFVNSVVDNLIFHKNIDNLYQFPVINSFSPSDIISTKQDIFSNSNIYISVSGNITRQDLIHELEPIMLKLKQDSSYEDNILNIESNDIKSFYSIEKSFLNEDELILILPFSGNHISTYYYLYLLNIFMSVTPSSILQVVNLNVSDINSYIYHNNYYSNIWVFHFKGDKLDKDYIRNIVINNLQNIKKGLYDISDVKLTLNLFLLNYLYNNFTDNSKIANVMNDIQFYWQDTNNYIEFINNMYYLNKNDLSRSLSYIDINKMTIISISK